MVISVSLMMYILCYSWWTELSSSEGILDIGSVVLEFVRITYARAILYISIDNFFIPISRNKSVYLNYYITFLIYNAKISDNNAEFGKVLRMLFPRWMAREILSKRNFLDFESPDSNKIKVV
jgi:hypothetical protein